MAYTKLQDLRKMRARNKGSNKRLAAALRRTAAWLEKKGPEEFTKAEAKAFRALWTMLDQRLFANVLTASVQDILDGKQKTKYTY
jgi:hypothetical protein